MKKINGYIFAKLEHIGSKSEGPAYFLQQWDNNGKITEDSPIEKKVERHEIDPELYQFLARKVTIVGQLKKKIIHYEKIMDYEHNQTPISNDLKLKLKIEGHHYNESSDVLWINKQPSPSHTPPPQLQQLYITLLVEWPYRSIWQGQCPTTQLYDVNIEDPDGNLIWQWSKCMLFTEKTTSVNIWGGSPVEFPVTWNYFANAIEKMGAYTVRSKFIASSQNVDKKFTIKFAY